MSDIAAGDVTYTVKNLRTLGNSKKHNRIQLAFGNATLTYPAGGVPISIAKLGCPNAVESAIVVEQGTSGYQFQYDTTNKKLIMIQGGSHTHDLFLRDNVVGADTATTKIGVASGSKMGANTGANVTISGLAAASGNGGIVAVVAGQGGEPSAVAIAAQTVVLEIIGW